MFLLLSLLVKLEESVIIMVKVKNPDEIAKLITTGAYEKKRLFSITAHIDR